MCAAFEAREGNRLMKVRVRGEWCCTSEEDESNAQPYLLLSQALFRMGKTEEARAAKETSQRLRTARPEAMNVPQARPFPN